MTAPVAIVEELLTESQAVRRIPGEDARVRAWLRSLGITRLSPTGVRVYRWSEVLAQLPLENEPAAPAPKRRASALRKSPAL